jgi:hypothetical protein
MEKPRFRGFLEERAMGLEPTTPSLGNRAGFANSGGVVFVDESAEQIAAAKAGRRGQQRWVAAAGPAVGW